MQTDHLDPIPPFDDGSAAPPPTPPAFDDGSAAPPNDSSATHDLFMENFKALEDVLSELVSQNLKRSHENIVEKFASKNISNQLAEEILRISLERELITSYRYAGQVNYKVKSASAPTATICDPVQDATTGTESLFISLNDFNLFKHHISQEIETLRNTINQQQTIIFEKSQNQQTPQVEILLKHIEFLQNTITTLVQQRSLPTTSPTLTQTSVSNPKSPPPAIRPIPAPRPMPRPQSHQVSPIVQSRTSAPAAPELPVHTPTPSTLPTTRKFNKKQVLIFGDSMLNCIDEQSMRQDAFVRVRNHPGATVEDLIDHARAHTRNVQHDGIIIMAGHNDISINNRDENKNQPKRDTISHMQALIRQMKAVTPDNTHIAICQVTGRKDQKGIMKDVNELNSQFKQLAQREQVGFVSTSNFDPFKHTGKKGVHPNEKGIDSIFNTLEKYTRKISRL